MNLRGKLFLDDNSRFYLIKKDLYIYMKFDLRFELSFLERFPFSRPRRNQILPLLLPTSCVTAATTPVGVYETILSVEIRIRRKSSNRVSCTYKVSTHSRLS